MLQKSQDGRAFWQLPRRLLVRGRRLLRNAAMDLRYGAFLGGTLHTGHARTGATMVVNTDYAVMPQIFRGRISAPDVLVDVGCGRGRVINFWLSQNLGNRIVGLELDAEVARQARHRLRRHRNVEIIGGDAVRNLPADGTVFFLFNPFHEQVMTAFQQRMLELFGDRPHVTILYYAPVHVDLFAQDPRWRVSLEPVVIPDSEFSPSLDRHRQLAVIRPAG